MNLRFRTGRNALLMLLPALWLSDPARAASDVTGPLLPPPTQTPFASAAVTEVASYAPNPGSGSMEYNLRFRLAPQSDGLAPTAEDTLISAGPDPGDPLAGQIPAFQVFIPAGCFVDSTGRSVRYAVNGLGCGVDVRLHDPLTLNDVPLNADVTRFHAMLVHRVNRRPGYLRLTIGFVGFNPPADANPHGMLTFTMGNDGAQGLTMQGRAVTRGTQ